MDGDANFAVIPCGHQCGCEPCLTQIQATTRKCPICQGHFAGKLPIFAAGVDDDDDAAADDGSLSTIHASSTALAFKRMALYASMAEQHYSPEFVAELIGSSLDFVVHLRRLRNGQRVVSSVREVTGATDAQVSSNEWWKPRPDGRGVPSVMAVTEKQERLIEHGFDPALMDRRQGWWTE